MSRKWDGSWGLVSFAGGTRQAVKSCTEMVGGKGVFDFKS